MLKIGKFMSQVRAEMKKVSWPTRQELISSTVVVLISTILLAIFIGLCDVVLSRTIHFLIRGGF